MYSALRAKHVVRGDIKQLVGGFQGLPVAQHHVEHLVNLLFFGAGGSEPRCGGPLLLGGLGGCRRLRAGGLLLQWEALQHFGGRQAARRGGASGRGKAEHLPLPEPAEPRGARGIVKIQRVQARG